MSRQATKACGNMYYEARIKAAKYNQKFLTRAGAAEELPGVTEDSLKKYELGINRPPNIAVALMADAYAAPELRNWYCSEECPLGKDCRDIEAMPAERALLRLSNALDGMDDIIKELSEIMDDGRIDDEEFERMPAIREGILEVRRRADENLASLEKALKRREF